MLLIQKLHTNAKVPTRGSSGAAGYDLYSTDDCILYGNGGQINVPTGLAIKVPTSFPNVAMITVIVIIGMFARNVFMSNVSPTLTKKNGTTKPIAINLITFSSCVLFCWLIFFMDACNRKPPSIAPIK